MYLSSSSPAQHISRRTRKIISHTQKLLPRKVLVKNNLHYLEPPEIGCVLLPYLCLNGI